MKNELISKKESSGITFLEAQSAIEAHQQAAKYHEASAKYHVESAIRHYQAVRNFEAKALIKNGEYVEILHGHQNLNS
jgi:hypothetical protein